MAKLEKVNLLNYPIFFMTKETKCPYIGNKSEKRLVTDLNNNPFYLTNYLYLGLEELKIGCIDLLVVIVMNVNLTG